MKKQEATPIARFADMLAAMGAEPRLRIMRLLLSAHPEGMVVGEIQAELGIPSSTLSHHLEKLKTERLVGVERQSTHLRYRADGESLKELLDFLYAECFARNKTIKLGNTVSPSQSSCNVISKGSRPWISKKL